MIVRELPHERSVAVAVSWVRLGLCVLNFGVIALDASTPLETTPLALTRSLLAATGLFVYALLALVLLVRRAISVDFYSLWSPLFDVLGASTLILATNGHMSPFNLWLVFAVVASGTGRFRWLPVATTALGMAAHLAIAAVPQAQPLVPSVFFVRTVYLFAFGAVLAILSAQLSGHASALSTLERASRRFGEAMDMTAASNMMFDAVRTMRGFIAAHLVLSDGREFRTGHSPAESRWYRLDVLRAMRTDVGRLETHWRRSLSRTEVSLLRGLCERLAATIARIQLSEALVRSAAEDERIRVADELHDTYIQTLAAIDLHAEAIRLQLDSPSEATEAALHEIKRIARRASAEAREVLESGIEDEAPGLDAIEAILKRRWQGTMSFKVDRLASLDEARWRSVAMMVREGLRNATKHGGATHVDFTVERTGDWIVASLRQNGKELCGEPRFGYGLNRLKSEAEALGGELSLKNAVEGGTVLSIRYPRSV